MEQKANGGNVMSENRDREIESLSPGEMEGNLIDLINRFRRIYSKYPNAKVIYNREEYVDTFGNKDTYFSLNIVNPSRRKK